MESEKYLEGQSMQRPPLFESDGFIYWKNRFETYVKSKDLDLWHVITYGDFPPIQYNPETKKDETVSFDKQNDDLKKKLAKNNEAKMVIYNALPRKEYERIFMCKTAKEIWDTLLITHQDVYYLRSVETEFPAIVFNDNLTSNETLFCEPTVSSLSNDEIDFRISFDEFDDEDYMVVFDKNSFSYKIIYANDLKTDSKTDNEKVNMPLFPSPEPTVSCLNDLDFFKDFENEFLAIVYNDALTSKSDFSTEPTLFPQHINEFDLKDETSMSEYDEEEQNILDRVYSLAELGGDYSILEAHWYMSSFWSSLVHLEEEIETVGFGAYWSESATQIPDKGDLRDYWIRILSTRDFLGTAPSYTSIRDLILRLCHRLIACSIAGRNQTPENVTMTDLFYLKGIDVGSVNIPYLLARQQVVVAGAPEAAKDAPVVDEGAQADPAPVQAPQPPPPARTMPQRMARLEEDVHEIRVALGKHREVMDAMARDFSRFTIWAVRGISQLLDSVGATYV
ncbi:hypothetical protein Tco_0961701 [Tanacetum coccineum]